MTASPATAEGLSLLQRDPGHGQQPRRTHGSGSKTGDQPYNPPLPSAPSKLPWKLRNSLQSSDS